jgi:hypothetical protein
MVHTHQSGCFILHDIMMKLVLLGFAGSTQPTSTSDAVGAASAAIKIRGAPYFIAPEGAPTEAFHFFVLI